MRILIFSFALVSVVLSSNVARADGYFKAGLLYVSDKSGSEGTPGDTTRTLMDFGAGYQDPKGWLLGALYSSDKTSSGGNSVDRTAMGPTIGWMATKDNGAFIMATYLYTATYSTMNGSGYKIDLGYKFLIGKVGLGAQLSKTTITYDKANGAAMSPKYIEDKLDPFIVMIITF